MRTNAQVMDLVYGAGKVIAVDGNVVEVFFKQMSEIKYYENHNGKLYLILDNGIAQNPTASFSNKIGLSEEGISMTKPGRMTRGIKLERVSPMSRSYQIAQTLMDEDLNKKQIFDAMQIDVSGKVLGGYHSNTFSALSDAGVIQFNRASKKWSKGPKFDYFLFVVAQ